MATLFDAPTHTVPGASRFGLRLFLASLTMFFGASMVGYLTLRFTAPSWPPPGWPGLPPILWASTALILATSASLLLAVRSARRRGPAHGRTLLLVALALSLAFLICQLMAWRHMMAAGLPPQDSLVSWAFYLLTFLHGLHVVGGLVPLIWTTAKAAPTLTGVELVAEYFHFLDVVWLVLFFVLWL
jgi:cytochrome c oxidase subunit 3